MAGIAQQLRFDDELQIEEEEYLSKQLITYLGNKRALLAHIGQQVAEVKTRLGKKRLRLWDAFAGSGVVSRYFKAHAEVLVSSDIEDYAAVIGRCHLRNRSEIDYTHLCAVAQALNREVLAVNLPCGFLEEMYAPADEANITATDRVFFTKQNARRLDSYRRLLGGLGDDDRRMLLAPLLSEASIHANTAGVFKGFYRDRHTGLGRFGGSNGDALSRIRGPITLAPPVLSRFECDVEVRQEDANEVARQLKDLDLVYLDPPYNQHPYGSNYFMLNLIVCYQRPQTVSRVSGIPVDWRRSDYNRRQGCLTRMSELAHSVEAKFILVSFNDEGFINPQEMRALLGELGKVETVQIPYNAFRGSRNLNGRSLHVTEQLFLVERR